MIEFRPHPVDWNAEKVARFWDYLARHHAEEFFSEKHASDIAGRLIDATHARTVVDIGCGTGPLVAELTRRGIQATGIDSSPEVLDIARVRAPNASFHLGSVSSIPLANDSVDAALLIEVVEHLDDDALERGLAEARRVVRQGGALIITTPNSEDLALSTRQCPDCGAEFHIYQHVRRWSAVSLKSHLSERGFSASVSGVRFLEHGPLLTQLVRRAYYSVSRSRPRLLAIATKR